MPEPVCICGHGKSEHRERESGMIEFETHRPYTHHACVCGCRHYREVVDWPTSEGWWWCNYGYGSTATEIVESIKDDDGCWFYSELYEQNMSRTRFDIVHVKRYGPARFVKLREPNPFIEQAKGQA